MTEPRPQRLRKAALWLGAGLALLGGLFLLVPRSWINRAAGYPAEVRRTAPPATMDQSALGVGATANSEALPSTSGPWTLESDGRQLVVFYRGHW